MTRTVFSRRLREYMATAMTTRDQLVVAEIADEFIDEYPELVEQEKRALVFRAVQSAMKDLCSLDDKGGDQPALFDGLPVGIAVAPGVIKPRNKCNWADLMVGRDERKANIGHARDRFKRYNDALRRLRPLMSVNPHLTVEQAAAMIAGEGDAS